MYEDLSKPVLAVRQVQIQVQDDEGDKDVIDDIDEG